MLKGISETISFRFLRWIILSILVLGVILLFLGFRLQNKVIVSTAYSLVPFGIGLSILYEDMKTSGIQKKTKEFSENLSHISELIKRDPDKGIDELDSFLLESVDWDGFPISPSFLTAYRMLEQFKSYLTNPTYRGKTELKKDSDGVVGTFLLASHLESIARALSLSDSELVFKAVRNFVFFMVDRFDFEEKESDFDDIAPALIEDFHDVSILLRLDQVPNNFWEAQDRFGSLLETLRKGLDQNDEKCKWLLLMCYWLLIHFKDFENRREPRSRFWLGRSKVLAIFINNLIDAYNEENFRDFVEIMSESFDGRFRIPRRLYEHGVAG